MPTLVFIVLFCLYFRRRRSDAIKDKHKYKNFLALSAKTLWKTHPILLCIMPKESMPNCHKVRYISHWQFQEFCVDGSVADYAYLILWFLLLMNRLLYASNFRFFSSCLQKNGPSSLFVTYLTYQVDFNLIWYTLMCFVYVCMYICVYVYKNI